MCNAIRAAALWLAALTDMQIKALLMAAILSGFSVWCLGSEIKHQNQMIAELKKTIEEDMDGGEEEK
jgi:hypothetical protein